MSKVVRIESFGGPEVMTLRSEPTPTPGPGEALVSHIAMGLNYLDISQRLGHYPLALPTGLGVAGCGIIKAVGPEVEHIKSGDVVAYAGVSPGSYADERVIIADRLVPLRDDVDPIVAAAALQQGITAAFLLDDVFQIKPGHTVLFHAAAGGVGTIACQWAKSLGASLVIGTVSNERKAVHALAHGCDIVIDYSRENIVERVRAVTAGRGVDVVYDSVGAATVDASLECLAFRGMLVSFGSASGDIPPLDVQRLATAGSLYLTRPRFIHYTRDRADLFRYSYSFFDKLKEHLKVPITRSFSLRDVQHAHREMEGRATIGSSVLLPTATNPN